MYLIMNGKQISVAEGTTRIGRSANAHICLEDATVSRRHAMLVREGESVRLLDDRSLNGVFVNGERVSQKDLVHGDVLQIGRHEMRFEAPVTRPIAA